KPGHISIPVAARAAGEGRIRRTEGRLLPLVARRYYLHLALSKSREVWPGLSLRSAGAWKTQPPPHHKARYRQSPYISEAWIVSRNRGSSLIGKKFSVRCGSGGSGPRSRSLIFITASYSPTALSSMIKAAWVRASSDSGVKPRIHKVARTPPSTG